MINNRVTIFSNTNTSDLSRDINTFIKWQEAIGNVIHDIKLSTCDSSCEAMVIWQMCTDNGYCADLGNPEYNLSFNLEGVECSICTDDLDVIQQIIDLEDLIRNLTVLTTNEDGDIETIYERAKQSRSLKIPKWRKEEPSEWIEEDDE